jgi:hypothetical protein
MRFITNGFYPVDYLLNLRVCSLILHYDNHVLPPLKTKKGHGFCRHGLKKKNHGSSFDLPMAVLVYFTLPNPPQRQADQCKIGIKPITINIVVCS